MLLYVGERIFDFFCVSRGNDWNKNFLEYFFMSILDVWYVIYSWILGLEKIEI